MIAKTYSAMLRGDQLEWTGDAPDRAESGQPVRVTVTVLDELETPDQRAERGRKMREALERLAELGTFAHITDPVAWQREVRKDRPLLRREEE